MPNSYVSDLEKVIATEDIESKELSESIDLLIEAGDDLMYASGNLSTAYAKAKEKWYHAKQVASASKIK